jgi:thiol-disulfide isomerase/thioredoxin
MADTRRIIALIPLVMTAVLLADQETQRQGAQDAASTLRIVGPRDLPGDDVIVVLKPRTGDGGPNWSPKGATVPLEPTKDGLEGTFQLGSVDCAGNRPIRVLLSRTDPDAAAFDRLSIDADRDGQFSQAESFEARPTSSKGNLQTSWSVSISLEVSQPDGSPRMLSYPIRLWLGVDTADADAKPALRWTRGGWMQGQAELDGEVVDIALAEGTLDGVYDEVDAWTLSQTPDGIAGTTTSYRSGSEHAWLGDQAWRIASIHPSGLQITLRRFDPGHTRLEEMRIRDQFAADRRAPRAEQPLAFRNNFTEAEAEAKRLGRPLFIDFETTWCGPCKRMNALVYTARPVTDAVLACELVAVKVDGDEQRDIVERFGVNAYPTLILLDAQGREIRRAVGYQGVASMRDFLTLMPNDGQVEAASQ